MPIEKQDVSSFFFSLRHHTKKDADILSMPNRSASNQNTTPTSGAQKGMQ
jgi:hypothetical protein